MNPFIRFIKENVPEEERPIKLGIRLDKVVYDRYGRGKDSRYMRVFVGEHDVTQMAANLIGKKPSKARDTYGDIIVHGCGMDMCYALADMIRNKCFYEGEEHLISSLGYTEV